MHRGIVGMGMLFTMVLLVGLAGFIILPGIWKVGFASLAGLSGFGLGVSGYAVVKQEGETSLESGR
jgi:hypothetical protein